MVGPGRYLASLRHCSFIYKFGRSNKVSELSVTSREKLTDSPFPLKYPAFGHLKKNLR